MESMSYEPDPATNVKRILCCQCGIVIEPNPANMCVSCLRTEVDITEGIPKQATIHFCRGCERYLHPPAEWIHCALESRELLGLCLKKLKGLNRVKLVDAGFVWTEPHSKRIKVKLTVQGEVIGSAVLQQMFVVEYTIAHQMCDDCHRTEAKDFWKALVQIRQKADNKKTFYYLEQLILKHKAHETSLGIKPIHGGLDFFFATENQARKMVDFLSTVLPCRNHHSKKLLSHDIHSNLYNYKFTYCVELVPISKDSVVCLPKKLCQQLGGIGSLCVVLRVTNAIHIIDPNSAQLAEVKANAYWKEPFYSVCNPKQMVEYTVMDVEPIMDKDRSFFPGQGPISNRHVLADVWLVKSSELGITDNTIHTRSHIGHLLKPGDTVMGYCLSESNINNDCFESLSRDTIPDVILVKKVYGDGTARRRRRAWKLKHLQVDDRNSIGSANMDYNEFLDDLEEDSIYRKNVNIYRDPSKPIIPVDLNDIVDPGPCVTLEEMIDELTIQDEEMT